MSFAAIPFHELPHISSRPWLKISSRMPDLTIRTTPTAKNVIEAIGCKAADADPTKNPGDIEVLITTEELEQRLQKSRRCIEYALEEIGPTQLALGSEAA